MRILIHRSDRMLTLPYLPEEATELFGADTLEEDGVEVPDELALEVANTYKHLCELSNKLERYRK